MLRTSIGGGLVRGLGLALADDADEQLELAEGGRGWGSVASRGGGGAAGSDMPITTLLSMKYMNQTVPFPSSDAKPPCESSSLKASAAVGTRLLSSTLSLPA